MEVIHAECEHDRIRNWLGLIVRDLQLEGLTLRSFEDQESLVEGPLVVPET